MLVSMSCEPGEPSAGVYASAEPRLPTPAVTATRSMPVAMRRAIWFRMRSSGAYMTHGNVQNVSP